MKQTKNDIMKVTRLAFRDLKKGDLFNFNGLAVAVGEIKNYSNESKIEFEYYENGTLKRTSKYFKAYDKVIVICG